MLHKHIRGCQSGCGRLLSVENVIEAGTYCHGDSGWASAGRPGGGYLPPYLPYGLSHRGYLPPFQCIPAHYLCSTNAQEVAKKKETGAEAEAEEAESAAEDDGPVSYNSSGAEYVSKSEWVRSLDHRDDPTVAFKLPLPPGDIRKYIGRRGAIIPRGTEFTQIRQKENRTATESQCNALKKFLTVPAYNCKDPKRFGNAGDGGWTVCLDRPLPTPSMSCVSYSFGLAFDWTYDAAVSKVCSDHAFDPTLRVKGSTDMRHDEKQVPPPLPPAPAAAPARPRRSTAQRTCRASPRHSGAAQRPHAPSGKNGGPSSAVLKDSLSFFFTFYSGPPLRTALETILPQA